MDSDFKARKQVTPEQVTALLDFMKGHEELAKGLNRGRRGKLHTLKLWNTCAKTLNTLNDGACKDGRGWSKYWCDWKYRVRRKALELKAAKDSNIPAHEEMLPLSETDKDILSIIGETSLEGVVIKTDPLSGENDETFCNEDEDNTPLHQYFESDTNLNASNSYKRRKQSQDNNFDNSGGVSLENTRMPTSDQQANPNLDAGTSEFLKLEREKLDHTISISESLKIIASGVTRLADTLAHVRNIMINNRTDLS